MTFIAAFLALVIRNRLYILDADCVGIPAKIAEEAGDEDIFEVDDETGKHYYMKQNPLLGIT